MPFTVTITEYSSDPQVEPVKRFEQTVDSLNTQAVIQAVNTPPPAVPKPKKPRSDKGITRGPKTTPAATV